MNAVSKIEAVSTDIALIVAQTPVVVLTDKAQRESFYASIEREVAAFKADTTTQKGRDAIRAMAGKVTKTKTAIDAAGKELNEDARAQINAVDAERRAAKEYLGALAIKVRLPLTEWEDAEEARNTLADTLIAGFKGDAVVTMEDTADTVRDRGQYVWNFELVDLGDRLGEVQAAKELTVATLKAAMARLTQEEADRAELAKLRAVQAERDAKDLADAEAASLIEREAQIAAERIEYKRAYARKTIEYIGEVGLGMIGGKRYPYGILLHELEEKITVSETEFGEMAGDVEKARVDTLDRLNKAMAEDSKRQREAVVNKAAQDARDAEANKATAERDKLAIEHAAALATEKHRADESERIAEEGRRAAAKVISDAKAEADTAAAEQAKRDANKAHRGRIMSAAKLAIMSCGADEETARKIVLTIQAGEVPNVTLRF